MRFRTLLIILLLLPSVGILQSCSLNTGYGIYFQNESSFETLYCECVGFVNERGTSGIQPIRSNLTIAFHGQWSGNPTPGIRYFLWTDSAFVKLYNINENGDTCLLKHWTFLDDRDHGYSPFNLDTLPLEEGITEYVTHYWWRFSITDEMLEQDTISREQAR